jgi:chromosome segregation protein
VQAVEIELTKLQTKVETLHGEISREVTASVQNQIEQWSETRHDQDQLLIQIEQLKHQLELIGGIDPEIVQEHSDTKQRFDFLSTQAKDLRKTITALDDIIDELDTTIKRQFDKSFKAINKNFSHYFTLLFGGGEARLDVQIAADEPVPAPTTPVAIELADEPKPAAYSLGKLKKKQRIISGIDMMAHPPGKKLSTIHALSGGEKSLTAIALLCAIIGANTPPFVVMDEVEAALDETNSEKVAAIVKHLAEKTQFVVITHNRATMQQADVLYGVTMQSDGTSKILSVKLTEAEKMVLPNKV